ncbi:WASH complex subunit 3 [Pectinophora gossypiella]|uniref:WASH complex subunit 3 n=1 Tax=Pectinophora gossypiella TaxID=13191 RepID=A0A1E1VY18_PECGO|nr:WASH complex subunit 3 [Pectinophora gossypiella]
MTLQDTLGNRELADLDLSKVAALQQKRTLAFVNHFVITTVQFLNNFMKKCEHKLMHFERKLEKVEAAMVLLEARLSSIPEVNTEPEQKPQKTPDEVEPSQTVDQTDSEPPKGESDNKAEEPPAPEPSAPVHPEYERFVKMVQVGVPLEAVKLKVSLEGLDPNMLVKVLGK